MPEHPFAEKIMEWYHHNKRELPWRETKDPYKIWLSEVILQQTRVEQGRPYYSKFLDSFPTIQDLANADEQTVLRLWQGLGYYNRAKNMHSTAKFISENLDGKWPTTFQGLIQLKGLGPYTAAAVASLAFGEKKAVVDGNVFRVLSRYFGLFDDISSSKAKKTFQLLADELISPTSPADYNSAVMEFGATFCTPKKPSCQTCIFQDTCWAFNNKAVTQLPFKSKKTATQDRYIDYYILEKEGKFGFNKRNNTSFWPDMYDFPNLEANQETQLPDKETYSLLQQIYHQLSHRNLYIRFFFCKKSLPFEHKDIEWLTLEEAEHLPKPIIIANFLSILKNR